MLAWRDGEPYYNKKTRKKYATHVGMREDYGMPQRRSMTLGSGHAEAL
jgi:hypothetical protein